MSAVKAGKPLYIYFSNKHNTLVGPPSAVNEDMIDALKCMDYLNRRDKISRDINKFESWQENEFGGIDMKRLKYTKANAAGTRVSKIFKVNGMELQVQLETPIKGIIMNLITKDIVMVVFGKTPAGMQKKVKESLSELGVNFNDETREK